MQYVVVFLEGIITFISPCLLPMLPLYICYFAGNNTTSTSHTLKNALSFVFGFTVVFVCLGAFVATIGSFIREYNYIVSVICGIIVIFFGINFISDFKFNFFKGIHKEVNTDNLNVVSSFLFGMIFSISFSPCIGTFLGAALIQATQAGSAFNGIIMLFIYSLGLGIPFIISAIFIDKMKSAFDFIKSHYKIINMVSGIFLIVVGISMCLGIFHKFLFALAN